jgi:putative transcriptional regulator
MSELIWSNEFEKGKKLEAGKLLLAEPFMSDENFSRAVVLICQHDDKEGTVGLILTKQVKLPISEVVAEFNNFKGRLFLGGPVGTDSLQFFHRLGEKIEGSLKLADNLYWGGNFEQIKMLVELHQINENDICFYLGYAGWSIGQLEEEMEDDSWIVTDSTAEHVFDIRPETLWKTIMRGMGGVYERMAGYPENPILN